MSGLYGVGLSGLKAFQQAINLTSHNIANANTKGFSRREVMFSGLNNDIFGNGVEVSSVTRAYSQVAVENVRSTQSQFSKTEAYSLRANDVQTYLDNDSISISKAMDDAFGALQQVNANPASSSSRKIYLNQLTTLGQRFNDLSNKVASENNIINRQMSQTTDEVNSITSQIAAINDKIKNASEGQKLDLLDQRDQLLNKLSQNISYSTLEHDNGTVDIYVGSGNPVVVDTKVTSFTTITNAENPAYLDVALNVNNQKVPITNFITDGSISGLSHYRQEIIEPMSNELGRMALVISDKFNEQNKLGLDLNGTLGSNIFKDINTTTLTSGRALANTSNTATATINVNIDDASQLTNSNYRLTFTSATNYTLTRVSDNAVVNSGSVGSLPQQISADGFTVDVNSGSIAAGDSYLISPTRNAAAEFGLQIQDPAKIATALPINASRSTSNTGTGQIGQISVVDTTNASFSTPGQLSPPVKIQFLSATSYQIVNANTTAVMEGPITYNPGANNDIFPTPGGYDPGYRVQLYGNPQAGDTFDISYNNNGVGDNRNGLLLNDLHNARLVNNGQMTINESYNSMISNVAIRVNANEVSHNSNKVVFEQAQSSRDEISGVNIDEETVNLLQYEKAYQASANVIATANRLFDVLLGIGQR